MSRKDLSLKPYKANRVMEPNEFSSTKEAWFYEEGKGIYVCIEGESKVYSAIIPWYKIQRSLKRFEKE